MSNKTAQARHHDNGGRVRGLRHVSLRHIPHCPSSAKSTPLRMSRSASNSYAHGAAAHVPVTQTFLGDGSRTSRRRAPNSTLHRRPLAFSPSRLLAWPHRSTAAPALSVFPAPPPHPAHSVCDFPKDPTADVESAPAQSPSEPSAHRAGRRRALG